MQYTLSYALGSTNPSGVLPRYSITLILCCETSHIIKMTRSTFVQALFSSYRSVTRF